MEVLRHGYHYSNTKPNCCFKLYIYILYVYSLMAIMQLNSAFFTCFEASKLLVLEQKYAEWMITPFNESTNTLFNNIGFQRSFSRAYFHIYYHSATFFFVVTLHMGWNDIKHMYGWVISYVYSTTLGSILNIYVIAFHLAN